MNFFISMLAAFIITWVGGVNLIHFLFWLLYRNSNAGHGSFEGLEILIFSLVASPFIFITLSFLFYINIERLRTKGVVLGGIIGFYVMTLLELFVVGTFVKEFIHIPFIIIGCILISRTPIRRVVNGMAVGMVTGVIAAYHIIVILRWLDNTLATSFYSLSLLGSLSFGEMSLYIFVITSCLVTGALIERSMK
ncbi:hypothetical protein [Halalkalibacter nanhaiisediminis]|uniref:Uncharacterized protein n=1 Tax=Halalkalibacter nanhaiisediminis TaxID=688079 RepID=A0A562QM38_9BACI|nr:hypothetical protein [Halalkalibacter nanhaiisediminis]TWI57799.1 hypothetical protein IQ10_01127 [Halalkalibacter nanhaiisediminis]